MKTNAAVILGAGQEWTVTEIDLAEPQAGEVLVEFTHAGLCFSDEHLRHGGLGELPAVGGHEGAGIVRAIGPGVTGLAVGDHVAASFIPTCGQCEWCVTGHSNLCTQSANIPGGADRSKYRFSLEGDLISANCGLGTFARHSVVSERTVIKVDPSIPLSVVAVASCGVLTGWGAAVHAGEVSTGDVVLVLGAGGVGINAIQGARLAGAKEVILVDTNPAKLESAQSFGATRTFTSMDDATEYARQASGVVEGADVVIVCTGNTTEPIVTAAYSALGKRGRLVLAGMSQDVFDKNVQLPGTQLIFKEQTIKGTIYGSCNPRRDVPLLLDLYKRGLIKLDELVSKEYSLDDINQGFEDLRSGKNLRGVVAHG
ncbi:Zn-dependent alcohol dehydrogenase [Leucobacter sp. Z1108]|uniref:Zn-dependent alcohol dehydrogenase n=1 Tax=Leucobacter sp. Z1108 TaxID=3439066 RepID=UPI003F40BA00